VSVQGRSSAWFACWRLWLPCGAGEPEPELGRWWAPFARIVAQTWSAGSAPDFSPSYSWVVPQEPRRWAIKTTGDVRDWLRALGRNNRDVYRSVNAAIDMLAEVGPELGRPLVDTLQGSNLSNLKELRPRSGRDAPYTTPGWLRRGRGGRGS
jgi:hypothetical protein